MKLNIQLFGGRGATSSKEATKERAGLKSYFSRAREGLKNVAFKSGNKDVITDSYSMYQLNKTGLEYSKNKKTTEGVKRFVKMMNEYDKQISNYTDIKDYITNKESYSISNDYSFNTKMIKQAKTILGKDTKVGIVYKEVGFGSNSKQQPTMILKNKKGEKGMILPQRIY